MNFTESNTVEALIRDLLCGSQPDTSPARREEGLVNSTVVRRAGDVGGRWLPSRT